LRGYGWKGLAESSNFGTEALNLVNELLNTRELRELSTKLLKFNAEGCDGGSRG
jgi:hypothetical protein